MGWTLKGIFVQVLPPKKTAKLTNDITSFTQMEGESYIGLGAI